MATVYANIKGIRLIREAPEGGAGAVAMITFTIPAYTSGDTGKMGAGGYYRGTALVTADTLASLITATRRDGKTILIGNPVGTVKSVAICVESGLQGSTSAWAGGFALADTNANITFSLANSAGTDTTFASGVVDREISIMVSYTVA